MCKTTSVLYRFSELQNSHCTKHSIIQHHTVSFKDACKTWQNQVSALLPSLLGDSWLITLRFHGWSRSVCRGVIIISGGGGRPGLCLLGKDGFSFLWRHCGRDRSSIQLGLLHGAHGIHGQDVPELLDLGSKTSQSSDVRHIRTGGDRRSWMLCIPVVT